VKDWPITIDETEYAYRAWGALQNTPDHNFYVSNDLKNWKLVSTFQIPTLGSVPGGTVYYGFHDVLCLNGTYYAWGECNVGHTLVCRSYNADDVWEAFARVGGLYSGPLQLPAPGTPTGSFFELGGDRGYGKIMVPGDDSAFYLAINTVAKPSLLPAELKAFINPANWTWHDGTTGLPCTPILAATVEHDCRECWLVPSSSTSWTVIYDADFGAAEGGKALGYAILSIPIPNTPPVADAGPDQVVEQESYEGTELTLDGSGSTDPDSTPGTNDDIIGFGWYEGDTLLGSGETLNHTFALGIHTVTLLVSDSFGETDQDEVVITVEDTSPPTIQSVSADPDRLWPPNHKMVEVTVTVEAEDICDPAPVCWIVGVLCSEPVNDPGDGNTEPDWDFTDDPLVVMLRAESAGIGTGRVYTICVECMDVSERIAIATVDVTVPHDQGAGKKKGKQ